MFSQGLLGICNPELQLDPFALGLIISDETHRPTCLPTLRVDLYVIGGLPMMAMTESIAEKRHGFVRKNAVAFVPEMAG